MYLLYSTPQKISVYLSARGLQKDDTGIVDGVLEWNPDLV